MDYLTKAYWNHQYSSNQIGWDVGYATKPLTAYIDQLTEKKLRILIPGAGNAYEAEYLYNAGFTNTKVLEFAGNAIEKFTKRVPHFPIENILNVDFFKHSGQYDLILEQTFFTSIARNNRKAYVNKMVELLSKGGKLVGLLFNHEFGEKYPPFGGTKEEYMALFKGNFEIEKMEIANNSIKPRNGRELFFILKKPEL